MNKANGTQTEDKIRIFARTLEERNQQKNERYDERRAKQLRELTHFFEAYSSSKSIESEADLLRFIMRDLIRKAKTEYRKVWEERELEKGDADLPAESHVATKIEQIWKKLQRGGFSSPESLQKRMGYCCKNFRSEAEEEFRPKAEQIVTVPLYVVVDGEEVSIEETGAPSIQPVFTPSSDGATQIDEAKFFDEESKKAAIHVCQTPMTNSLTRENVLFLPFLSPEHAETFETLRDFEGDRSEAAICLGLTEDGMNQRIHRMSERYQNMRELRFAFRQPSEHLDDLTDRFIDFTKRLQTLSKPEFPRTLAIAVAQCAEDLPVPDAAVLCDPYEVMNHLLRIWRPHRPASQ